MENFIYTVLVVGDNPLELLQKYDNNQHTEIKKYKKEDSEKIFNDTIKFTENIIKSSNGNELVVDYCNKILLSLKEEGHENYFARLTQNYKIDENGDFYIEHNPNGKWTRIQQGGGKSTPLIKFDGNQCYTAYNSEIDWYYLNWNNSDKYKKVWELFKENKKPNTIEEETIYNNMKKFSYVLDNFKTKEDYVAYNCNYSTYAYLDEHGWIDIDSSNLSLFFWITNYNDKFIKKLKPTDKISVFEYTKD